MIITTKRSNLRYFLDILLTALGWLFFIYLFFAGIVAILSGGMQGPQIPLVSPVFLTSAQTVINYVIIALINANLLIGWAVYNQFRFTGKDRRQPPQPLTPLHLQKSFALSPALFDDVQNADVMVVYHDENHMIGIIDILSENPASDTGLKNIPKTAKKITVSI